MGKKPEKKRKKFPDPLETTMSLGDHLEELRARLILAILGLVIGTVICIAFGRRIIHFIERPYLLEMRKHLRVKAEASVKDNKTADPSAYVMEAFYTNLLDALAVDPNAPGIDPNAVKFAHKIYLETKAKLTKDPNYVEIAVDAASSMMEHDLIAIAPADPFIAYMKITLIAGLILSSPWVFYHLWMFVGAGLYEHERKYVHTAVPFSTVLFVTGSLFFLFVIARLCLRFFLTFGDLIGVSANWTFDKYISFVTMLMLVFGLAFQTPIAIFVLNRTGLVSIESFKKSRKYVVVAVFFIAAVATPPDVVSQIALAIPLYALFELGLLLSWLSIRKEKLRETAK
ncbi:MAG: twin arginine-targeting protein translocase TatC [Planctomycetes bacterium RBG_16_55_9]|nr:MAG: twin arginine-targeting protein translocase TatC [Planctomycetes bacterium RBG_16_55_9]